MRLWAGLAAAMLGRALGAYFIIGTDPSPQRRKLALKLQLVDVALPADDAALGEIKRLTKDKGCEVAVDASGVGSARLLALQVSTCPILAYFIIGILSNSGNGRVRQVRTVACTDWLAVPAKPKSDINVSNNGWYALQQMR